MSSFFQIRVRPWGLLTAAGFLGALGTCAGFLGRHAWWLDLGSHFRVQYTLIFLALALCYSLGRKWKWTAACVAVAAINAIPVVSFLLPREEYSRIRPENRLKATLINVNTTHGNPEAVIQFLQQENPDIVILEEVDDHWLEKLASWAGSYPTRIVESRSDNFGIALFTRAKATSSRIAYFGFTDVPSIVATLEGPSGPFTVIATHPPPPGSRFASELRNEHLADLAEFCSTLDLPILLLGDLNVTPWSPYYRTFMKASGLKNSSQGRAIHPTWPTVLPFFLIPLDHALHSKEIAISAKRVGPHVGSDHFPVVVEFATRE